MFRRFLVLTAALASFSLAATLKGSPYTQVAQRSGVTIAGSVVDGALNPIPGATITLERTGRVEARTTSDASGLFRFAAIAAGTYTVKAEHAGFPVFTRELRVPNSTTALRLPIVLIRPGDELQSSKADASSASPSQAQVQRAPAAGGAGGGRGGGNTGIVGGLAGGAQTQAPPSLRIQPYVPESQLQDAVGEQRYRDPLDGPWSGYRYPHSGERYAHVDPNRFQFTRDDPLSTFGADVDTASYSNVRRFLSAGQLPPRDAVRIEEFINYFRFPYDEPRDGRPLRLTTEIGDCPWAPTHKLVLIGARAKASVPREIEGRNIVLLIDVSGSMAPPERLPLIKTALGMFVDTLQADDRLAIVTYAGTSGIALPSTSVRQRDVIQRAIANLSAGGSTNGGQGLIMAYRVARQAFMPGGVNRVILATDGDFNVGIVSQTDLLHLIEREKDSGVFLSVFGVGSGNLKDSMMELLADKGNGHYAYLDSLQEARRVLVHETDATLETVAKDVKFQVEFNPAMVNAWKLIGYEDRLLAPQDFNNDRKDGGEMGAGHTVTVLYEVVPVGVENPDADGTGRPPVDPLRYQTRAPELKLGPTGGTPQPPARHDVTATAQKGEWLTVKARYKAPEGERSDVIVQPVAGTGRIQQLPLAAAIAEFGLLLRSGSRDTARWDALERRTRSLDLAPAMRSDVDAFKELVAIGSGLSRRR